MADKADSSIRRDGYEVKLKQETKQQIVLRFKKTKDIYLLLDHFPKEYTVCAEGLEQALGPIVYIDNPVRDGEIVEMQISAVFIEGNKRQVF